MLIRAETPMSAKVAIAEERRRITDFAGKDGFFSAEKKWVI